MSDARTGDLNQEQSVKRSRLATSTAPRVSSPLARSSMSADDDNNANANANDGLSSVQPSRRPMLINNEHSSQQNQGGNAGGQQQQQQPPPQAAGGGLFGGSTQQGSQQPAQQTGSGLFGGSTQQTGASLFGGASASQPQQASGLFGSAQASQPQQIGGLFGGTSQPQQQSGGLFGSSLNQAQQQQQPNQSSSLFGASLNRPGGLFGSSTTQQPQPTGSSLFGGSTTQQPQQTGSSLFGGTTAMGSEGGSSLFGGSTTQQPQQTGSSLFDANQQQQQQQQQQPTSSIFGLTATQPSFNQPTSLLGASQYRSSQYPSFSGKLTLGQPTSTSTPGAGAAVGGGQQGGQGTQGAVQIDVSTMRPSTRFSDLIPSVQQELERIDTMIRNQEAFCRQIEALIPVHGNNVRSLQPDVDLIKEKAEAVESALSVDARGVEGEKKVLMEKDGKDGERVIRVVENLRLPSQYRYAGQQQQRQLHSTGDDGGKDFDLIGKYFTPLTNDLQNTLDAYATNLSEIEAHMRVIESSAVAQAQMLAGKRAGVSSQQQSGEDTVRDLAETLRGFEQSILGAAGLVGECREGVNGLVLGRVGGRR